MDEVDGRHTAQEHEADQFASSFLLSKHLYQDFVAETTRFSIHGVEQFASQVGIAPGIVVGRLQHDKLIPYSYLNDLKVRFTLVENQ